MRRDPVSAQPKRGIKKSTMEKNPAHAGHARWVKTSAPVRCTYCMHLCTVTTTTTEALDNEGRGRISMDRSAILK